MEKRRVNRIHGNYHSHKILRYCANFFFFSLKAGRNHAIYLHPFAIDLLKYKNSPRFHPDHLCVEKKKKKRCKVPLGSGLFYRCWNTSIDGQIDSLPTERLHSWACQTWIDICYDFFRFRLNIGKLVGRNLYKERSTALHAKHMSFGWKSNRHSLKSALLTAYLGGSTIKWWAI